MGRAYHEALPEIVDHVCLGEGEAPFRAALERLKRGQDLSRIPGLTWAKEGAVQPATGTILQDLSQSPMPDYTAYFSAVEALRTSTGVSLSLDFLPFESSRGCWWGQRNHCVFCGLNPEVLPFRAKQAETVVEEILTLTRRYGTTRLLATDWIMSRQHRIEVLKPLAEQEIDLDIFYESRVDLTRSDFHALHGAGVRRVQPGIEALSTPLLKLMRKHTSGLRQVQFLRWCLEFGIDPVYNLLSGFPGEEAAWYAETAALVPLLVHLPPPRRNLITVEMHRFSPLFRERERFAVREIRPRADYRYNFPPGVIDLTRSCYFFEYDSDALPDPGEEHAALEAAIDAWLSAHRGPRPPRCELRVGPGFVEIIVLDEPAVVVAVLEVEEGHPKVFDSFKRPQPQQLLLQRLDESLRNPVAFGLADEGGAGRDPEELHLGLEVVAGVLAAVVVPQRQPQRRVLLVATEVFAHTLAEWFQGLEPGAVAGGVDADALAGAVIHRDEDRGLSFSRQAARRIRSPHLIGQVGGDPAVVDLPPSWTVEVGCGESGLAHQLADAILCGEDATLSEASPDLSVSLPVEVGGGDDRADGRRQFVVGESRGWSPPPHFGAIRTVFLRRIHR